MFGQDRWQRINDLFDAALEQPLDKRAEFLREACGKDAALLAEVESLLAHSATEGHWARSIVPQIAGQFASRGADDLIGEVLGAYRITGRIGAGGMGVVYEGERADEQIQKRVALKIIQPGLDHASIERRFLAERQILAGLEHANIAHLLDAGHTGDGRPYLVMELVDGLPITTYCDQNQLSIPARLKLFLTVCDAVNYAHRHLVIHCDLKPSNILVTAAGEVKLLDFGVARLLTAETDSDSALKTLAAFLLTPAYSSPEQVRGGRVTTASDVYSLGVILYELLARCRPYELKDLSWAELNSTISELEIDRPSLAAGRNRTLSDAQRNQIAGDLDHIVMLALRKDPAERFTSAAHLADDIRRHLDGLPVIAAPPSAVYRVRKFLRRNRIPVVAAAAVALALITGASVAIWQGRRAERRFEQVRKLANTFLFDFEKSVRPLPGSTPSRQLVVKTALVYLESLSQEAGRDAALVRELSAAYRKIGEIQGSSTRANLGDTAGALISYRKAVDLLDSIGERDSRNPALVNNYLRTLLDLGTAQSWNGDLSESVAIARGSIEIADRALALAPSDRDTLNMASAVRGRLSDYLRRSGDLQGSLKYRLQSVDLRRRLAAQRPSDRVDLALGLSQLSSVYETLRQPENAIQTLRECIAIQRALAQTETQTPISRRERMVSMAKLSGFLVELPARTDAQLDEALDLGQAAFEIAKDASAADPANLRAVGDVAMTGSRYASALSEAKRSKESFEIYRLAIEAADEQVRRDAQDRVALFLRSSIRARYAYRLGKQGLFAQSIAERRIAEDDFARLAAAAPKDRSIRFAQAANWMDFGRVLVDAKRPQEALPYFRQGIDVAQRLADADPADKAVREMLERLRGLAAGVKAPQ